MKGRIKRWGKVYNPGLSRLLSGHHGISRLNVWGLWAGKNWIVKLSIRTTKLYLTPDFLRCKRKRTSVSSSQHHNGLIIDILNSLSNGNNTSWPLDNEYDKLLLMPYSEQKKMSAQLPVFLLYPSTAWFSRIRFRMAFISNCSFLYWKLAVICMLYWGVRESVNKTVWTLT